MGLGGRSGDGRGRGGGRVTRAKHSKDPIVSPNTILPPSLLPPLRHRTGGVYIPPFKLAQMRAQMEAEGKKEVRQNGRQGGGGGGGGGGAKACV
jgi:hypothetical protein